MNVFDKILGLTLIDDVTDTPWWTDTVFRALEQEGSIERGVEPEVEGPAGQQTSEAI